MIRVDVTAGLSAAAVLALTGGAAAQCGAVGTGSCLEVNGTRSCEDAACCEAVCAIDPFCCEQAWDGVCVFEAIENCQTGCGDPGTGSCFDANGSPFCDDEACCESVCLTDPSCCSTLWDSDCVLQAQATCSTTTGCGSPAAGDCLEVNDTPACDDPVCCDIVCTADPMCCNDAWDATCVNIALLNCTTLGECQPPACSLSVHVECLDLASPQYDNRTPVGQIVSELGQYMCTGFLIGDCGDEAAAIVRTHCIDGILGPGDRVLPGTRMRFNAECDSCAGGDLKPVADYPVTDVLITDDALGYAIIMVGGDPVADWGQLVIDDRPAVPGLPVYEIHHALGRPKAYTQGTVAGVEELGCLPPIPDEEGVQARVNLSGTATVSGTPIFRFDSHAVWLFGNCGTVCGIGYATPMEHIIESAIDALTGAGCELVFWDDLLTCGAPGAGNCLVANNTPGCDDAECCQTVCDIDNFCCETAWDSFCASVAKRQCKVDVPTCQEATAPCGEAHATPGCEDDKCCFAICDEDPFCCEIEWDEFCVEAAFANTRECRDVTLPMCGDLDAGCCFLANDTPGCSNTLTCFGGEPPNCPGSGPCDLPNATPGCEDATCCIIVCTQDPLCCEETWDNVCATTAVNICDLPVLICGAQGTGDCFVPNGTPGCNDEACCNLVCEVDPLCCSKAWDVSCAILAGSACGTCVGGTGSCLEPNGTPGCAVPACCAVVCQHDPACCAEAWDEQCATLGQSLCMECPGTGPCTLPNGTPGCEDRGCCTLVCQIDPTCCSQGWDAACVGLALGDANNPGVCRLFVGLPQKDKDGKGTDTITLSCCEAVIAQDDFCIEEWDATCAQLAADICWNAGSSCLSENEFEPGCDNSDCESLVCQVMPECCTGVWDTSCVGHAEELCQTSRDCFDLNEFAGGCDDSDCEDLVCEKDENCCDDAWDAACVELALDLCVSVQSNCFEPAECFHDPLADPLEPFPQDERCVGCGDAFCTQQVCLTDSYCCVVQWDARCVALATRMCQCGGLLTGSCFVEHDSPYCSATLDCDSPYQSCGTADAGDCLDPRGNGSPGCERQCCCALICRLDDFCCDVEWDSACAELAGDLCTFGNCETTEQACGDPGAGDCFNLSGSGTPGCNCQCCCEAVCQIDSSCCDEVWDEQCAQLANDACDEEMCAPSCCDIVCFFDDFCCEVAWDTSCVSLAIDLCQDASCGAPGTGCCALPHDSPYCNDPACCQQVCDQDPFCCDVEWDAACVDVAETTADCMPDEGEFGPQLCCGEPGSGGCFTPNLSPLCNDGDTCSAVCDLDPLCCELIWDQQCANLAATVAVAGPDECGDPDAGSCFEATSVPYCQDAACCTAVCKEDPFCCDSNWDQLCVNQAFVTCGEPGCGDPTAGNCLVANGSPSCADQSCCVVVCQIDQACCTMEWDAACATLANEHCSCGGPQTGSCFTANGTPACNNADAPGCCETVCAINPACCDIMWDTGCAQQAILLCLEPGTGDCFVPDTTPGCDDADCNAAVCAVDPSCCTTVWDENCAVLAVFACGPACGNGVCDDFEGTTLCPADCGTDCGDGVCNGLESSLNCLEDCGTVCGDGVCNGSETAATCPTDCSLPCPGDFSGNGAVDTADLLVLLADFGPCPGCATDLTGPLDAPDGVVDILDMLELLSLFGPCP